MDKMIFNSRPSWFYEEIHTKQRRAENKYLHFFLRLSGKDKQY